MSYRILGRGTQRSLAQKIFGSQGFLETEERFGNIRSAIVHLLYQHRFEGDQELGRLIQNLAESHQRLMEHPDIESVFTSEQIEKLQELMASIVATARGERYSEEDIHFFSELAAKGRELYERKEYDPEKFVPLPVLQFAKMVGRNYSTYDATTNEPFAHTKPS